MTTRREYTAQELEQTTRAEELLRARGLDEPNERVVDILDSYFQTYRSTPVTEASVVKLIEAQPSLKWLTPAELDYKRAAAVNPQAAQELVAWLNTHGGKPGTLVNSGDAAYENLSLLLGTLGGYEISTVRIQDAENRIANRAGRKLHYVPTPRRTEPVTPHAKADDGTAFVSSGLTLQRDGSLGKSPADYAREARARSDRDAAEANERRTGVSAQSAAIREAKSKAEGLRGNTHSESDQLQKLFVTVPGTSEINWPDTLAARLRLQKSLNLAQQTRRFVR